MSAGPTRGQSTTARAVMVRRSPALVAGAWIVDHALLAAVLAFAGWASVTGRGWPWIPAVVALAGMWEASEVSWDRTAGPLPSTRQLKVRGQLLAVGAAVVLVLLPPGVGQLPAALLLAAAVAVAVRHRIAGWELLAAGHAPGIRALRAAGRMTATAAGRATVGVPLLAGAAGLAAGVPASGALAAGLLVVAVRRHADAAGDRMLLEVRRALAGVLAGGRWDPRLADAGTAPITIELDDRRRPALIRLPLPPAWQADATDRLGAEVAARLRPWGTWLLDVDPSGRTAVARQAVPLPGRLLWDGLPGQDRAVVLGLGRIPRQALETDSGAPVGEVAPVVWDFGDDPHGLITGRTGRGKSVAVRSIILQWLLAGNRLLFLDPKRVEGAAFRGRPGVLAVAADLDEITGALEDLVGEMRRRYEVLESSGVTSFVDLPAAQRTGWLPILAVVDEAFELMSLAPGASASDQTKSDNDLRARCSVAIRAIAALGRAAGVHVILLAQRPDAKALSGDLKNNLSFRLLCGPADRIARAMTLGDDAAEEVAATPGVVGRAVARSIVLPATELQIAFVDPTELDRHLPRSSPVPPAAPDPDDPADPADPDAADDDVPPPPPAALPVSPVPDLDELDVDDVDDLAAFE